MCQVPGGPWKLGETSAALNQQAVLSPTQIADLRHYLRRADALCTKAERCDDARRVLGDDLYVAARLVQLCLQIVEMPYIGPQTQRKEVRP
jgi:hypothetical protein